MPPLGVLELTGEGRQLGRAHGEALREKIQDFYEQVFQIHSQNMILGAAREDLLDFCRTNTASLARFSPLLHEELIGIGEGSGLGLNKILFLNSFLELEDLRPPALGGRLLEKRLWGCTSFNILPEASKDGKVFLAQTYDMEPFYADYNTVLIIRRPSGSEIVYTMAGILGLNGLNDRGLGVVINKVVASDARPGVIYPVLIRQALSQDRLGDAFGAIVMAPRAAGMVYQLAGIDGLGFCLELSAGEYCLVPFEGAAAHTNHYTQPSMRPLETPHWLCHGGSFVRLESAKRFLKRNFGRIDLELLKEITRDHVNYPRSICAHYAPGERETSAGATIAGIILDLKDQAMHICSGNPCREEYRKITF